MKKNYLKLFILTLVSGTLFFSSCSDDGGGGGTVAPTQTTMELLEGNSDFSHFLDVIKKAGLEATFSGSTEYTLILPFNADMEAAGKFAANMTQAEARALVLYHLIAGKLSGTDFPANGYLSSENDGGPDGYKLSIYSNGQSGVTRLNGTQIEGDKGVTNGAVYPIQGVLTPPNLNDQLMNNENLKNYHAMASGETDANTLFKGTKMFTAFVTLNEPVQAFADSKNSTISRLAPSDKRAYLHKGLIDGKAHHSSGLVSGSYTTLGGDVTFAVSGNSININNKVNVITRDIIGTNGIMYILDGSFVQ